MRSSLAGSGKCSRAMASRSGGSVAMWGRDEERPEGLAPLLSSAPPFQAPAAMARGGFGRRWSRAQARTGSRSDWVWSRRGTTLVLAGAERVVLTARPKRKRGDRSSERGPGSVSLSARARVSRTGQKGSSDEGLSKDWFFVVCTFGRARLAKRVAVTRASSRGGRPAAADGSRPTAAQAQRSCPLLLLLLTPPRCCSLRPASTPSPRPTSIQEQQPTRT